MGKAASLCKEYMNFDYEHVKKLSNKLIKGLQDNIPQIVINGDLESRYPGSINISFAYVEGESLIMSIKDLAVSSGSACTSSTLEPSYVLRALGVEEELAHTSLRLGIGRFTTEKEIDYTIEKISKGVNHLRNLSPLWELVQEGVDLKTIEWAQH